MMAGCSEALRCFCAVLVCLYLQGVIANTRERFSFLKLLMGIELVSVFLYFSYKIAAQLKDKRS